MHFACLLAKWTVCPERKSLLQGLYWARPLYRFLNDRIEHSRKFNLGFCNDLATQQRAIFLYGPSHASWSGNDWDAAHVNMTSCSCVITDHRMDESSLQSSLAHCADATNMLCYVCGPSPMIDSVKEMLTQLGLSEAQIFFEKWWWLGQGCQLGAGSFCPWLYIL